MTPALAEVEAFRHVVARRLGLAFDEARTGILVGALTRHAAALGASAGEYVQQLDGVASSKLRCHRARAETGRRGLNRS